MFKSEKIKSGFYTSVIRNKNMLYYRGYDGEGNRVEEKIKYKPIVYLPSRNKSDYVALDTKEPLEPLEFESMSALRQHQRDYENVEGFEVFGQTKHTNALIQRLFPQEIKFDKSWIDIGSFDIETSYTDEDGENTFPDARNPRNKILTIAYKSSKCDTYIVWGMKDYNVSGVQKRLGAEYKVEYRQFPSESEMASDFVEFFSENCPDILTGWNSRLFDIPYLIARFASLIGDKVQMMSPWGKIEKREISIYDKNHILYDIAGVASLDYMDLYKKFTYTQQESYSLNHIAHVELKDKKLDYSEVGTLRELYDLDFDMFVDYNIKDVELLERFEDKLGLITLVLFVAYKTGSNYNDVLGTTSIWDSFIHRRVQVNNIIVPPKRNAPNYPVPGGYVKQPVPGRYKNIMSFDFASLYPNIMIQCNISPDTMIPHAKVDLTPEMILSGEYKKLNLDPDISYACNGTAYSTHKQGIVPEIIEELYSERKAVKNEMISYEKEREALSVDDPNRVELDRKISLANTKQMAIKILLNSLYGAIANTHFRFFNADMASAITLTGQTAIKWAELNGNKAISKSLKETKERDRTIMVDTDSNYYNCDDVVKKYKPKNVVNFLDKYGSEYMEPMFEKSFAELASILGSFKNRLAMDREVIADSGVVVAKKRYFLSVQNNEGVQYAEPKLKIMGIEAIKSSTPSFCRAKMKEMFKTILYKSEAETQKEIEDFKKKFFEASPEEIGMPRGVSEIKKYCDRQGNYKKGTPIHSRGSILYNKLVKKHNLEGKCPLIQGGDKIKFVYLKKENPIKENVISFPADGLPRELDIHKYIDFETQFEKTFISPVEMILKAINWKIEDVADLDSFFG